MSDVQVQQLGCWMLLVVVVIYRMPGHQPRASPVLQG